MADRPHTPDGAERGTMNIATFARLLGSLREQGRHGERASRLVQAIKQGDIARWKDDFPTSTISVDMRGLRFDIGPLHEHLPPHKISTDTLIALEKGRLIDDSSLNLLRALMRPSEPDSGLADEQLLAELETVGATLIGSSSREKIAGALLSEPEPLAGLLANGAHLSPATLAYALDGHSDPRPRTQRAILLASLAERVAAHCAHGVDPDALSIESRLNATGSFDELEKKLTAPEYLPVVQILRTICKPEIITELRASGAHMARGRYRGGAEGLLIGYEGSLARIYLTPEQVVHDAPGYGMIHLLERKQFTTLSNILRPYAFMMRAIDRIINDLLPRAQERNTASSADAQRELAALMSSIESIVGINLQEHYLDLHNFISPLMRADAIDLSDHHNTHMLRTRLETIRTAYKAKLSASSPDELLSSVSNEVLRMHVTLDEHYLDGLPAELRSERDSAGRPTRYDQSIIELLRDHPIVIPVSYLAEGDYSSDQVLQILSTIGIKPGPTIATETGSAYLADQGERETTREASRILVRVAGEKALNLSISDTQCGGGAILGEEILRAQIAAGDAGATYSGHPFCIAAGGHVYIQGLPYWTESYESDDPSERQNIYAGSPVPTAATRERAYWAAHEAGARYAKQSIRERTTFSQLGGNARCTVVMNGGPFVVMKINMDMRFPGHIVFVEGTGRFGSLACELIRRAVVGHTNTWKDLPEADLMTRIQESTEALPAPAKAAATKDLATPLGREQILVFLRTLDPSKVRTSSIETLAETLREVLPQ